MITKIAFAAFSEEFRAIQLADENTPSDYLETRAAVMTKLGLAMPAAAPGMMGRAVNAIKPHATHAAEIAGLGILAKPSIDEMRGKEVSQRRKAGTELAGLGILAAPAAAGIYKHFRP